MTARPDPVAIAVATGKHVVVLQGRLFVRRAERSGWGTEIILTETQLQSPEVVRKALDDSFAALRARIERDLQLP